MTDPGHPDPAVSDPIGLMVGLVTAVEDHLQTEQIHTVVVSVAGGRAKARRLATALAERPSVLVDGRSPAPKAVGDLLIALHKAGATSIALPRCTKCGKPMQYLQRRNQDWYCVLCHGQREACTTCGNVRRVFRRDRSGQPYCPSCQDPDGRDPVDVIHAVVTVLDATVHREVVAEAVRQATARPSSRRKLAWALEDNPCLLTGDGHLTPLRTVLPLIEHLVRAGVAGIVRPACPRCRRVVRIDKAIDGQRLCRACFAKAHTTECSRCGAVREPATRDEQGRPLCPNCLINDPANLEMCIRCGECRTVHTRTSDGPLCPKCRPLPILTCVICSRTTGCAISRLTGSPRCTACMQRRSRCIHCHRVRQIHSGTIEQPVCGPCTNPTDDLWQPCAGCGSTERLSASRRCLRCALHRRLDELIPLSNGTSPPGLRILRHALASAERPKSALQWLAVSTVSTVLKDVCAGRRELTHQALDALPAGKELDHLRSVLVATGALPARDEHLARLERLVTELIAAHPDHEVRQILHRYAVWHLLRRLRRRTKDAETTHHQLITVRSHLRAAVGILDWLAAQHLTLATCSQGDLERWLTSEHASFRETTGHFIRWAVKHKAAQGLSFPAVRWAGPSRPLDGEKRWSIARRLLHDEDIAAEHRLAGLLLLLYAQTPAAISRLTIDRIRQVDAAVSIRFGDVPVTLPEPLARLATEQVALRRGHPVLVATPSIWLFPGRQPGRPISTAAMGDRLRKLGIGPAETRSTALFQMAAELPAAVLARTLGIHISVAVRWQRASAGDWAAYAADVSERRR